MQYTSNKSHENQTWCLSLILITDRQTERHRKHNLLGGRNNNKSVQRQHLRQSWVIHTPKGQTVGKGLLCNHWHFSSNGMLLALLLSALLLPYWFTILCVKYGYCISAADTSEKASWYSLLSQLVISGTVWICGIALDFKAKCEKTQSEVSVVRQPAVYIPDN